MSLTYELEVRSGSFLQGPPLRLVLLSISLELL